MQQSNLSMNLGFELVYPVNDTKICHKPQDKLINFYKPALGRIRTSDILKEKYLL